MSAVMPSGPPEKLFADRLQNAGPGEPIDVWVYSAFRKDDWVARKPGDLTHADHPGTALQIGDDLFEIVRLEETAEPGYAVRYGLKKWDRQHAVRKAIPYTPEMQARSASEYLEERRRQELRRRILWLYPLVGMAPDPLLREWEKKTALNMTLASAFSAVTTAVLSITLFQIFGKSENKAFRAFIVYLGAESIIRLLWIVVSQKAHGTPVVTFPYLLYEAVAHPEKRRQEKEARLQFAYERDEVIRRPGTDRLVVRSMLFDDMLAGPSPIRYEGAIYQPDHWYEEGTGLSRRVIFEFQKIDEDPKAQYREYTRPRTPDRQKAVEAFTRTRDKVRILALLWGTYPRDDQLRLQAKYHFPAIKWTAHTAGLLLFVALLQIWISILMHTTIFAIVGPFYLILESFYRLYRCKIRGQPAASLAGYVLEVFLRPPP